MRNPGGSDQSLVLGPFTPMSQTDVNSGGNLAYPPYGSYVARVNGPATGLISNTIDQSSVVAAGDVDPADGLVHVRFVYAPVMQDPGHTPAEQPWFYVVVKNQTKGDAILYEKFSYAGEPGVPWQDGASGWKYLDWTLVDVAPGAGNLDVGDTITLEAIAADCAQGGHAGYVYVDEFGSKISGPTIVASGPATTTAGATITYTYNYQNGSTSSVANAQVKVTVPAQTAFSAVSDTTNCAEAGGVVTCTFGTLAAAATGSFTMDVVVDGGATGSINHGDYQISADLTPTVTGPVVVTTIPPNQAPTNIGLDNWYIQEERPVGVVVGNLTTTDPDLGDTHSYSLVDTFACAGPDNGFFSVASDALKTSSTPIDFQTKQAYTVCIRTTDNASATYDKQFTIIARSINQTVGDFNGDGLDEVAVFRPTTGTWHIYNNLPNITYGTYGDLPVPADYNGDGKDEIAVFRPSTGTWHIRGTSPVVTFGANGDIPLPADYNGDGKDDIAVFRPSTGEWIINNVGTFTFGTNGDIPTPADYNGDGNVDIAVFRPTTGNWYIRTIGVFLYGTLGDIPVAADYNGDGKADLAVYRPSNGTWYVRAQGSTVFGTTYDMPLAMNYTSKTKATFVVVHVNGIALDWNIYGFGTITFGGAADDPF